MPDLFLRLRDDDGPETPPPPLPEDEDEVLALLREADFVASKLIPWGSNYSFAAALETDGREILAIYKPRSGEVPLYDFPDGTLYLRETAAYVLSRLLGWNLVPPTVVRDGPQGIGSVQLYIEPMPDDDEDPREFWGSCREEIERLVLFDHVANNADRKLSHCLRDRSGKIWGIDHGLTFNEYPKLRTVLWQFVGQPISPSLVDDLREMQAQEQTVREQLREYLSRAELNALSARVDRLVTTGRYPLLNPHRNIPYGWW